MTNVLGHYYNKYSFTQIMLLWNDKISCTSCKDSETQQIILPQFFRFSVSVSTKKVLIQILRLKYKL